MAATPDRQRVQAELERCAKAIAEHKPALEEAYADRDDLYVEGVELGMTQVQLAAWADSTPEAVAKVLRKRRDATGAR